MAEPEITKFLGALATRLRVSASTQNQAFSALLFLYRTVLGRELTGLRGTPRAKLSERVPVVLSPREVAEILGVMSGVPELVASLLYASGLRISEALQLRVKDIDFDRKEIVVRRSFCPFPRRITISLRSKSMSFTRNCMASERRRPEA